MWVDPTPPSEIHAMLMVKILDTRSGKVIWRLQASRTTTEMDELTQDRVNEFMAELLASFPRE
jgi:hypothetical protein